MPALVIMEMVVKPSFAAKINIRMVVFVGIILLLVGYPMYIFLDAALSKGIWERRDPVLGKYKFVDLKAMSLFEMEQINGTDDSIPPQYKELNGQRVMLEGEMYAARSANGRLADFDLVYSISKCCVGPQPKIQHFVKASVAKGKSAEFYNGQVQVLGTLHVGVLNEKGTITSVYRLDVERVDPKS